MTEAGLAAPLKVEKDFAAPVTERGRVPAAAVLEIIHELLPC